MSQSNAASRDEPVEQVLDQQAKPEGSSGTAEMEKYDTQAQPNLERVTSTASHKTIPIGTLDPSGTAELTRRLTEHSVRSRQAAAGLPPTTLEEGDEKRTFDPFDTTGKFDLAAFLREMLGHSDQRGNERRTMGLAFQDLTVTGIGAGVALNQSFGSMLVQPARSLAHLSSMRNPPIKKILDSFTGCVKPGEMLLVLGRPGSGCTSLLKTLASYRGGFRSIEGDMSWQGWSHKDINGSLRGDVVYAPEDDVHFPTLTVAQTLDFAISTRAPASGRRPGLSEDGKSTRDEYTSLAREAIATILGLRHTFNTKVGNELIRGISGGEKKRVSIAELMATRAKVAMYDSPTRGLDSSTAVEFGQALRIMTDLTDMTVCASVYQAGEGLTSLFDKVVVLAEGQCAYFGPLDKAADYFYELGFERHFKQTTADYLVSVTDEHARLFRKGFEDRAPRTPHELAAAWRNSEAGKQNAQETAAYMKELKDNHTAEAAAHYKAVQREEKAKHTRKDSPFVMSLPQQIRAAIKRRAQILWGDLPTQLIIMFASTFQSLIIGSCFYNMPQSTAGFFSRGGVLFFALLFNAFTAMTEVAAGYAQRPIVIRQARFSMIHPFSDALANTLLDLPLRAITSLPFSVIIYFLTGLVYRADAFFIYLAIVYLTTYLMVAFFRALAATFRNEANATLVAGLGIIDLALYAGYVIPRNSMVIWWRWLSYCNPIAFSFEILITNEFRYLNVPCASVIPSGEGYEAANVANQVCAVASGQPGELTIDGAAYALANYGYLFSNRGRNVGILLGFFFAFVIWYAAASEFQNDPSAKAGILIFKRGREPKSVKEAMYAKGTDLEKAEEKGIAEGGLTAEEEDEQQAAAVRELDFSSDVFSFSNVNYNVLVKKERRRLLSNVSGYVAPGKLTALMGESGAGKTTLLNVLAQRAGTGIVDGNFLVGGRRLPNSFQADTGYCQQQDTHLSTATVREALQFSALLRQPAERTRQQKLDYVESVIKMLEMEAFAEALVGEVGEGLNIEQRKRLTIAVELAARPKLLLFLDEPTSGLDAQAAWSIVRFLRKLADAGQAILCTIHQPSGELFNTMDRLILLKKGGEVVYNGDLGKNCSVILPYFAGVCGRECQEHENPAEYILDVIGAGATATTKFDWHQSYLNSSMHKDLITKLEEFAHSADGKQLSSEDIARGNREYAASWPVQFTMVTRRAITHYWRSPVYLTAKLGLNIFAGLFIGSSFWGQGKSITTASLQNKLFAIFMSLVLSTSLAQQQQPMFIRFRSLYEARERPSKMYAWPIAVISAILVEIPWNALGNTLYWAPWYFMTQFSFASDRVIYNWLALQFFSIYWLTFSSAMAALAPNAQLASVLFSVFFSFVIVFCGVVQPPPLQPYFWRIWMLPLSPFTYLLEGLLGNVLGPQLVRCAENEFNIVRPPTGQTCEAYLSPYFTRAFGYFEQRPDGDCQVCQYSRGEDFLTGLSTSNFAFSSSHRWRNLGILAAYIGFNVALALGLFYIARIHNWNKTKPAKKGSPEKSGKNADLPMQKAAAELTGNEKSEEGTTSANAEQEAEQAGPVGKDSSHSSSTPSP
ncbi:putative SNQ2-ABC transporter [Ceraceosorus guamensis]|uniref:Putative SNQ2-ABC transporter n=1 Tax=Ceraceosorus guamensis TaxID=1522189 RepID=A0A316VZY9_9BASI|nr:putative SNQ2-ABC transporter [Ceraceosorus guamensis]PWN42438.1 putative SNQ2-ABC transporter [Ceraceosorus guamensis]